MYWITVAKVEASDSSCRCIGEIIGRDLSLIASRLYRQAVTRPGSRVAVTSCRKMAKFCSIFHFGI